MTVEFGLHIGHCNGTGTKKQGGTQQMRKWTSIKTRKKQYYV